MMPIGPLMIEHRLIERMVAIIKRDMPSIEEETELPISFLDAAMDFFRNYADRCHHGKEEGLLFRDLARKPLTTEEKKLMEELIADHHRGREMVKALVMAKGRYVRGDHDARKEIHKAIMWLIDFYPTHIDKEERRFFLPAMRYFNQQERDAMLKEGWEFDRRLIHDIYQEMVETLEGNKR